MTNGKGSSQRPRQVSRSEFGDNWERTFSERGSPEFLEALEQLSKAIDDLKKEKSQENGE